MKDAIVRVSSSAQSRLMTALPNSNPDQSRETPFPENGQQTPLCRVDKIPVRWPRQRSWITAHFEKWWAICRPPPKCRVARRCAAPDRGRGARRWALSGRIHAGGDGRRTARGCAGRKASVAGYIATAKGLRERAIIAVLLGCALRRCAAAALTDGRGSGRFTPEATNARPSLVQPVAPARGAHP